MLQKISLLLLLLSGLYLKAQDRNGVSFSSFADEQSSRFISLYEKKDTSGYQQLLKTWLKEYNKLPADSQRYYSGYHINAFYNLCCTYALAGNKAMAIKYFEKALGAGYHNYTHITEDKDLDIIRTEPRFQELIRPLRETGDYLYILRKGSAYNFQDRRTLPEFTYQQADSPELTLLRKTFNLDSIAGKGNESSRVLNLLHWVHELIPHDGNHENPVVKNAMSMIAECRKAQRGLNCRGLATVLNECFLAMGYKSRLVTCLPKDSLGTDPDCHVINIVYLPSLKKWIWTDPTNDAYIMNENGELLGIEEVRKRIIEGRPLILNPTANWNHRSSTLKEYYLYQYMAKNLYILQCPVNSQYDYETREKGKTISYIQLNPLDYFKQQPDRKEIKSSSGETTYVYYNTNNPDLFWQAPGR